MHFYKVPMPAIIRRHEPRAKGLFGGVLALGLYLVSMREFGLHSLNLIGQGWSRLAVSGGLVPDILLLEALLGLAFAAYWTWIYQRGPRAQLLMPGARVLSSNIATSRRGPSKRRVVP